MDSVLAEVPFFVAQGNALLHASPKPHFSADSEALERILFVG